MQYSFDSSVETTLWVFSHGLICNSHSRVTSITGVPGSRRGKAVSLREPNWAQVSFNCVYEFLERHLSSETLIACYFARTEMLLPNMRMHNFTFVSGRCIRFERSYSVIQKFHHVPLCSSLVFVFMNHIQTGRSDWTRLRGKVDQIHKVLEVCDVPLMANLLLFRPLFFSEHCTSSLRATNRRCVASGQRRGVSRPSRRTTRPPAVSAARPSLQTAVATSAPTARPNSALAVEGGSLCAPTMWGTWTWPPPFPFSLSHSPHPCCSWCSVGPPASVLLSSAVLLPGHTLVRPKCIGRMAWHQSQSLQGSF